MKLRNKWTGEIREIKEILIDGMFIITSLASLNEEWEDYEDPKEKHWYMTSWGEVWQYGDGSLHEEWRILLGNDFETKEEAEKAVEKLKAFKRLKDLGFRFYGIRFSNEHNYIEWKIKAKNELTDDEIKEFRDALQKVFGGKK